MLSEFQDPRWKLLTDYQFKGLYAETALYLILKDLGYSPKWTGYNGYFKDNPHSGDFLLDGIRLDSKNVNGRYFISQYANALEGAYDIGIQFGRKSLEADREAYTRHGKLALILPKAIIEADILTAKGLTLKYQEYRGKLRYYLPKLMARLKPAKHSVHQSLRGISNKSYSMSYSLFNNPSNEPVYCAVSAPISISTLDGGNIDSVFNHSGQLVDRLSRHYIAHYIAHYVMIYVDGIYI